MGIVGGVALFVAGMATGGAALAYNQHCIKLSTARLRKENEYLKESAWKDRLEFETAKAYQHGQSEARQALTGKEESTNDRR